jgi:RNA polymerase sigma-70 factor (ECF subfamily)
MLSKLELSDEQIVEVVRLENKNLYEEIIKRYQPKLTHYLRKFIQNQDELEDVLQVVFIKAYQNLFSFNLRQKFSSWIYKIAHNEAVNYLKKNSRHPQISLEEKEYQIIDQKINLNQDFDQGLFKKEIQNSLNQVKLKYREPLILFFFEEKTYQEISEILRIPKGTVGTLISRAKKSLKKNLNIQKLNEESKK